MNYIDTDVYEPCKLGLQCLYDLVVPHGLIVFDDYSTIEGETRAVDEFFKDKAVRFHKFSFSHEKPVYMIKGEINWHHAPPPPNLPLKKFHTYHP